MGMEDLKKARESLERVEATEVHGAPVLTPRAQMLDARDVQAKHPDKHLRWVNIRDRQKADKRLQDGYVRLSNDEGGRHLGDDLALMGIPKQLHAARTEAVRQLNDERMRAHKTAMENAAEAVARQARDRFGVKIDARRILVDE